MPGLQGAQSSFFPDSGREVEPLTLLTQIFGSIHSNIFLNWKDREMSSGDDGGDDDDGGGGGGGGGGGDDNGNDRRGDVVVLMVE